MLRYVNCMLVCLITKIRSTKNCRNQAFRSLSVINDLWRIRIKVDTYTGLKITRCQIYRQEITSYVCWSEDLSSTDFLDKPRKPVDSKLDRICLFESTRVWTLFINYRKNSGYAWPSLQEWSVNFSHQRMHPYIPNKKLLRAKLIAKINGLFAIHKAPKVD